MKGALVFLAVFAIILVVSLGYAELPPGKQIYDAIGGIDIDYPILGISVSTLVPACFNGIVYGIIAWILYSVASGGIKAERVEVAVDVNVKEDQPKAKEDTTERVIPQTVSTPVQEKEKVG